MILGFAPAGQPTVPIAEELSADVLGFAIDIGRLQSHVREHVLPLPPYMVGKFFGGWSVFSSDGTYLDGWASGERVYDPNFMPGATFVEKQRATGVKPSMEYIVPTEICHGYLLEIMQALAAAGLRPRRARLSLLKAGGQSTRHRDAPHGEYAVRLHIPVITTPECVFQNDQGEIHMAAGSSAYLIDVSQMHQVFNRGSADRVHLIMQVTDSRHLSRYYRA